jgi:hypothetical protein
MLAPQLAEYAEAAQHGSSPIHFTLDTRQNCEQNSPSSKTFWGPILKINDSAFSFRREPKRARKCLETSRRRSGSLFGSAACVDFV